jgi:methylenetetrahydrofolate dehydrogenase (NADP+) / methenyltetrahydrofolate cyclohydrolase
MTATLLDGKAVAGTIRSEVAREVAEMEARCGAVPRLAAVLVGDDPASRVYVRNKIAACAEVGIRSEEIRLPAAASRESLLETLRRLNSDPDCDGILVQLPLPAGHDRTAVLLAIDPARDVDGLHPLNAGRLAMGLEAPAPCTPAGVVELLDRCGIAIAGRHAVIVGRSDIVGRPLGVLLTRRDATVTLCHSKTRDLPSLTRQADILVGAMGRPAFLRGEHIREGATVIDVGINRLDDPGRIAALFGADSPRVQETRERGYTLVGDVHPVEGPARAGYWTPVPGGVGPLTIACLLRNTLRAALARRALFPGR